MRAAAARPERPGPVALFGTSADPPSCGHRSLLAGLAATYPLVATWASDNPFKAHGAPLEVRARLLGAVVDALNRPGLRLEQGLSSPRAIETLERAGALWPGRELVFVVGSDLVPQIPRWYRARDILARCRLAVVPRQGWPVAPIDLQPLRDLGGRVELLPLSIPATASSAIRQRARRDQVPAELWTELIQHNLYGLGTPP